jgi:hypothetical protein
LIFVGPHAEGEPTFTRCHLSTKVINLVGAGDLDHLNGFSDAIPKLTFRNATWLIAARVTASSPLDVSGIAIPRARCLLAQ